MREYEISEQAFYREYLNNKYGDNKENIEKIKKTLMIIMKEECTPRQLVILSMILEGKRQNEVAQILGINKSTVCKTYKRGINNIAQRAKYLKPFI